MGEAARTASTTRYGGSEDIANSLAGVINLIMTKTPINKYATPIGVGRGIGSEIRRAFGSTLSQPLLDSTFGPAAEERPGTARAELCRFDFGDNSQDPIPGGYISRTLGTNEFLSRD